MTQQMDDLMLPPLPEPVWSHTDIYGDTRYGYDAYQMREYAKKAVEAERGACKVDISACVPRSGHKTPEWAMRERIFERINARR